MRNKVRKSNSPTCVFKAKLWKYRGPNGWYFLTLPKGLSLKIRKYHLSSEEGWGRLKTTCEIGKIKWRTAVWFDTKIGSYILPVKAEIRSKVCLEIDDAATCSLEFDDSNW